MTPRDIISGLLEAARVGAESFNDLAASTDPEEEAVRAEYERQAEEAWAAVEAAVAYLTTGKE
ncbi:hypothetical protein UFOVP786_16 [uncultured Caudovirales phage]|uniref:Uncharacterized protein n=1 Tax=uncultured Caudovirales phage TaxID=2100421 RepID=A0A6J5NY30_9CAUD|nr:hypothetical protein UFOVP786_16 [uncultured Caudovirales phage]